MIINLRANINFTQNVIAPNYYKQINRINLLNFFISQNL